MIYSKQDILDRCVPVFEKYQVQRVYLFGSYARNEATETSDIDLLIEKKRSNVQSLFDSMDFRKELERSLGKEVDLLNDVMLESKRMKTYQSFLREQILKERVLLYQK